MPLVSRIKLSGGVPTPDEFFLLLALVLAMVPLQAYLAASLQKKSTAGTSFLHCFFAISGAKFAVINEHESEGFRAALKKSQRTYITVMIPVLLVIFGLYLWVKSS